MQAITSTSKGKRAGRRTEEISLQPHT